MGANFTPTWNKYTDIKPFRFWCQKVLPSVYDDSLSYYELLCKVVAILNQVIDAMDEVEENTDALLVAFEQLQDYVNRYFEDANISEIINSVLDDMASSGELENLVKPYFDTWIEEAEAWARGTKDGVDVSASDPQYHNNSKYYAEQGEQNIEQSEAWAKGTINGTPVSSGADQYQNNSKYYAEQAAQAAQNATYANEAQAWATGSVNGTPVSSDAPQHENNAAYYANQAAQAAHDATYSDEAQAWATGSVGGTPVGSGAVQYHNNAKYYAEQAAQAAHDATYSDEAQAWATGEINGTPVTSDKPQYQNNAEYYATQAAASANTASVAAADIVDKAWLNLFGVIVTTGVVNKTPYNGGPDIPGLFQFTISNYSAGGSATWGDFEYTVGGMKLILCDSPTDNSVNRIFYPYNYSMGNYNGKKIFAIRVWDLSTGTWAVDGTVVSQFVGWFTAGSKYSYSEHGGVAINTI